MDGLLWLRVTLGPSREAIGLATASDAADGLPYIALVASLYPSLRLMGTPPLAPSPGSWVGIV